MRALAAALLAFALPAVAQVPSSSFDLRVDHGREDLDRGYADWRETAALLAWKPAAGQALLGGWRETHRFGLKDRETSAGLYQPLGSGWTVHAEGASSDTHRVLARWSALVELSRKLDGGWVGAFGVKHSDYSQGDTKLLTATVEKYFGPWRAGYTAYLSRPEGANWSPAHRVALSWYRGDLTHLTLSAALGREVENIPGAGLLASDIRAVALSGAVEVAPQWAVTFEGGQHRQGDLYTRRYGRLGFRALF